MKIVIAGSRTFRDAELLRATMESLGWPVTEVACGAAAGADALGEAWAAAAGIPVRRFLPAWGEFGRSAGPRRNAEMAAFADVVVVFWDGASRGAADMIAQMRRRGKPVRVVRFGEAGEEVS